MIRSMTGFGRGESQAEGKSFLVEIKAVNHRYCDVFVKMPRQLTFLEDKIRDMVSKSVSRGKLDIYISYEDYGEDSKTVLIDNVLAKTYIDAVHKLRDDYDLKDDISVSLIARFPDILKVEKVEQDENEIWNLLKIALQDAVKSLVEMRGIEGEKLKENLLERIQHIEEILKEITLQAPTVVLEYKQKLEARIKELLDQQTIDESRLAMEVALFADRSCIDEEIVRLGSHMVQAREALSMDQPVGRKLDFLIQEMNREINTIGSKANDLKITKKVVEIKSELEKVREQIQNIE
ncbi:MAG: YicC family protein [Clostridia bacterium]|nr:YicC family protein [Clostridia bacterium]